MQRPEIEIEALEEKGFTLIDQPAERGFTLIELSIVLVIIGLIVGGVLVGQDLIRAAEIRATISQIDKYNSAVNTFRGKYNGIPGDIVSSTASQLGFTAGSTAMTGTAGYGDGNGLIEAGTSGGTSSALGETLVFWNHLSQAGMIDGSFGASISAGTATVPAAITGGTLSQYLPPAKLGRGNSLTVFAVSGQNFWGIAGISGIASGGAYTFGGTGGAGGLLTPIEARNIDTKLDDGLPSNGNVQAMTTAMNATQYTPLAGASDTANNCALVGTPMTYDIGANGGNTQACMLRIRFN